MVVVAIVVVAELPGLTEPAFGVAVIEKSWVKHGASLPATFTAVHAAWTALYSTEQLPYRSDAALSE